jgi:myo-inositol-1(or 4)-monophosphatase
MKLNSILSPVTEVAKDCRPVHPPGKKNFRPDKIEYKGLNDLVSYVDKTAEQKIVAGLEKYSPKPALSPKKKPLPK